MGVANGEALRAAMPDAGDGGVVWCSSGMMAESDGLVPAPDKAGGKVEERDGVCDENERWNDRRELRCCRHIEFGGDRNGRASAIASVMQEQIG